MMYNEDSDNEAETKEGYMMNTEKLFFASDYMEGAYPKILEQLQATNLVKSPGYGTDSYTESAKDKIRRACKCPEGDVFFLVGGTQTNATVISAVLKDYEGVIAATTGHVSIHEAGAIEAGAHKVLTLPHHMGKLAAADVAQYAADFYADGNHDHMVFPGMVYISQPTEYGTLYTKAELQALHDVCRRYDMTLYVDGARLAYALACPENDVTLADLAALCDVFYIGGTKCGALFGEAVVIPKANYIPHFFTIIKQKGALVAKGRILGIQFDVLFEDGLYERVGQPAIQAAERLRTALQKKGYSLYIDSPTNQIFPILTNEEMEKLTAQVEVSFWEKYDENHTVIRIATSWATNEADVDKLIAIIETL